MTIYQSVFGGANIYPSDVSYRAVTLSANVTLTWPLETATSTDIATRIMDVTATSASLYMLMPNATKAGVGETVLLNNLGANSFTVKDSAGTQIVTVAPGETWQIYLADNSTAAGVWRSFQYGAAVSSANASALAGTGIVAIGTLLSQSVPITQFSADYSPGTADRAKMFVWTGASGTLTLPSPPTVGNNWFCYLKNAGSGQIVADPSGTALIDSASTLAFQPGESAIIATDGTDYYTIGFGQSSTFAFDYTVIDVSGTGNYTLTGTELNRIVYRFTGTLTGNRTVIVPATVQQYWVDNSTTGAYTLTVKTSGGTGQTISSGQRAIFYCDGTNVVDADTSTISLPVAVNQGGTGAITAGSALINLGGTSVGINLFTAVDTAAAWASLGNAPLMDGGVY